MSLMDRVRRWVGGKPAGPETELQRLARELLEGEDLGAKWRAAKALAELGDPAAFEPLAQALHHSEHYDYPGVAVALARVDPERAAPLLIRSLLSHQIAPLPARKALEAIGPSAFAPLLAQYRAEPYIDTANLLAELDCVEALPDLKRDLDRGEFAAYSTRTIESFLERHRDQWSGAESVTCHVCSRERPVTEMRGAGDLWFCPGECWRKSGEILSRGIGTDCPLYDRGFCKAGDGDAYCSLETGTYTDDCHVFAIQRKGG